MNEMALAEPEELIRLRDTLRRFVEREMPRSLARTWDRDDVFPREVFSKLADLGVMALTVPEDHGGAGRNITATMAVIEELSKRSSAVAVPYIMCACYAGMNIAESGSVGQKSELLPRIARGEILFSYGLTEPDAGADLASVKTRARRDGDRIVVTGTKRFCTGANISDYIYCLVESDPEAPRHKNLSVLLVPTNAPGITITVTDAIGMHGAPTNDVVMEAVALGPEAIVGGESGWNRGWETLVGPVLDVERLEVAAMAVGIAEAAIADAWDYAETRRQFGKPIASYQAIRHKLADLRMDALAARLMLYHAAGKADRGEPVGPESAMAKLFCTEKAKAITLDCQQLIGAYGLTPDYDIERLVREALILPIVGGSSNIQKNNIANMLGLARG
ncbi:MAG: acyl-CoA dehydrogenase family protein [Hyphomicrobiaceae bacterium]